MLYMTCERDGRTEFISIPVEREELPSFKSQIGTSVRDNLMLDDDVGEMDLWFCAELDMQFLTLPQRHSVRLFTVQDESQREFDLRRFDV